MHLWGALFGICQWWTRASHDRIDRIPSITISHHEYTVAHVPSVRAPPVAVCIARLSTRPLTTIAFASSSGASTNSETMELRELDKGPSTSWTPGTDDADITSVQHVVTSGEPIVRVRVGPVSEADPTVEIVVAAVDKG